MERREFIKHTAAMASIAAVGIEEAKANASAGPNALQRNAGIVLVDQRFSDSRRFAAEYAEHGARIVSLSEDIGRLWYGELRKHCLQPDAVIAGLTLHTDLFVSQQFAREHSMRFVQFGVHDCRGRSTLSHTLPANAALDLRVSESWAVDVARTMAASWASTRVPFPSPERVQVSSVVRASDHPGSLYSWMIVA